jgi:hypothetical protein
LGPQGNYSLFRDTVLFTGNAFRAASFDGTNDFWAGGAPASSSNFINGAFYLGTGPTSATAISTATNAGASNVRYCQFFNINGQPRLYFDCTASPPGLYYIAGFPKTGNSAVVTNLTLAVNAGGTGAPGSCGFAVSPDGNTIYIADGRGWSGTVANTTGGIQKWTNGVLDKILRPDPASSVGTMYLTADFSANPVVIYATTTAFGADLDQNEVVKVVDDGTSTGTATVLATAGANECFAGIAFGPNALPPHLDAITLLPDRNVRLTVSGSPDVSYTIEDSSSLAPVSWAPLATNSSATGLFQYDDLAATNSAKRYYRARYSP